MMTRKEQIEARDAKRQRLVSSVPGLSYWTVYEPQHPDTDLWINCLVAAYNADPTELIKDGANAPFAKHRVVAEKMYDRLKAQETERVEPTAPPAAPRGAVDIPSRTAGARAQLTPPPAAPLTPSRRPPREF